MNTSSTVDFSKQDYWLKIVDFLQQNWAVIEQTGSTSTVYFFSDTSTIFDKLTFESVAEAERALSYNGFRRYLDDQKAQEFIAKPTPPFVFGSHPNGNIYSSGKFWKSPPDDYIVHRKAKRKRATIIVEVDEKILLVETSHGLVLLPGGGIDKDELPIIAAARELHEETGLIATSISYLFNHESATNIHHVYLAKADGEPTPSSDAVNIYYYDSSNTIIGQNMSPATQTIINKYLATT